MTPLERFMAKVDKTDSCWLWTAALARGGYGVFRVDRILRPAHRWSYETFIGQIPEGLTIDHLCHTRVASECIDSAACPHRRCVNPYHLEPVTRRDNLFRGNSLTAKNSAKTACVNGHEFTPENTYLRADGSGRDCRACSHNRYLARTRSA